MAYVNPQKRRWSSKSLWSNCQVPNKIQLVDGRVLDGTNGSDLSDPASASLQLGPKSFKARFRRSGSRLLSIFRLRSSTAATRATMSSIDSSDRDIALAVEVSHPEPPSINPLRAPPYVERSYASDLRPLPRAYENSRTTSRELSRSQSSLNIRKRSSSLRRSQSAPGLAHMLSHKLSSTFGHPTIVHRTSLHSRPSIRSIKHDFPSPADLMVLDGTTQESTDPSSYAGSGSSPVQPSSTAPTSDGSPNRSRGRSFSPYDKPKTISFSPNADNKLAPIEEVPTTPIMIPSIVTVEATATAKIFFETHFNNLLAGVRPRSQRRKEFEARLDALNVSSEARIKALEAWLRQESEYLRKDRVLKSRTNGLKGTKGVSVAGYEVVKILGKGSFGVVRLVKEKPASSETSSKIELNQLKESAIDTVLPSRRRDLSKMKKEVYAMKVIRKSDMLRNCQEGHLRAERDFLVASEGSRWIVPLIASFQDYSNLYLVMDYMVGGDFLGLLIRKNILSEDVTRWYVAEMILCVEEAHRLQWIHRDVKPDNFLVGADGHLKISDFGLAFDGHWSHDQTFFNNHRHSLVERLGVQIEGDAQDQQEDATANKSRTLAAVLTSDGTQDAGIPSGGLDAHDRIVDWRNRNQQRRLAKSVVGTSQYMAPEVIRGELYDGRCDWWSVGIIMYECLYGFTPFACENRADTKLKILQHATTLRFPVEKPSERVISHYALDLMRHILREKETRLCSRKYLLNDYHPGSNSSQYMCKLDGHYTNYQGFYVYPDDADDIKAHPFFSGIKWRELHVRKPPFVPKVKSWEDTKYFEEDDPISDIDDETTDSEGGPEAPKTYEDAVAAASKLPSGHHAEGQAILDDHNGRTVNDIIAEQNQAMIDACAATVKTKKNKKGQKRPRDRILRDPKVGKQALEMRKRGAFLGYNYRRPRDVVVEDVPQMTRSRTKISGGVID